MTCCTIAIWPDETRRGKEAGHVKIVILDEDGGLIGVPVRGITNAEAKRLVDVVRYSFGYGTKAAEEAAHKAIRRGAVVVGDP